MRIVALDIIRFFAALSVVLYHYISRPESAAYPILSEVTNYGYLGVPLFFIISGYVIALSADNRTAAQFGISRFVRLYPTLWAGILFTVLVLFLLTDKQFPLSQVLANFTLINEYFGFESIDGIYWTLKHELKFYACIFLLLLFGVFQKYHIWLSIWLGLTVTYAIFGQPFFMGWFITPEYSSFFIAGISLFLIQHNGKNIFNHFILTSSLIISSFKAFGQADQFLINPDSTDKLISVAIIWLLYYLMYSLSTGKLQLKERKLFITIGALTYPLYLIHNRAGKALIDAYSDVIQEDIMIILVVILMVLIAWCINLIIEKPLATPMKNYLLSILSYRTYFKNRSRQSSSKSD